MKPTQSCHLKVFADYRQFYVWDPVASGQLAPEEWSDDDVQKKIKTGKHVVVICPERDMEVPVLVEVFSQDPGFHVAQWDHIAEAPLDVQSGTIEIHECTGGALAEFTVPPGTYRVRALYGALDSLSDDGLDGKDNYTVNIWPCENRPLQVIKQWNDKGEQAGGTLRR